jgi:alanyl-tRNA synthetase
VKFAGRVIDIPARDLKGMAEAMQKAIGGGVVALISTDGGKASVVVSVGPALVDRFNAIDLVRRASEAMGGKGGGGRPDMAQAGGPDIAAASAALAAVKGALAA